MDNKASVHENALENRCPNCTASISFNPLVGKWKCEYCGGEFNLEEMKSHSKNDSTNSKNIENGIQQNVDITEYTTYHCESCGAEIITDNKTTAATFCVYCGATAILKSKLSGKFAPELIIPFKKTKLDAINKFKSLAKGRPLVPKDFIVENNIEKIRGIYIPFWLYDIKISGDLHMIGTNTETWIKGNKRFVKTDKYKVVRGGTIEYNNIPVDGSKRFDNAIMDSIEPFKFNEAVQYNHAYLSGFYAERYDEDDNEMFNRATKRAINSAIEKFKKSAPEYQEILVETNSFKSKEEKKVYALLPVWMVNIKYKNKMHTFAMNGQTGEFVGNIPIDVDKMIIYSIMIFIISLIVIIFLSYIISGVWL